MALDLHYIAAVDLQEYLVDKDSGLPLSGGYIEFWQDDARTTPKNVFQLTGNPPNYTYSALPNPLTLSAVGTTVDDNGDYTPIYYYPFDEDMELQYYYVSIYNSEGVLQYSLQAWPNIGTKDDPSSASAGFENQLSNPQFVDVLFEPSLGLTISSADAVEEVSYPIAPDWDLIVTSSGAFSIVLQQVSYEGSLNIPTNPPFSLSVQPTGGTITELRLRQTISNNPDIWSATSAESGYVSGIFLATSLDSQSHTIEMQYVQSAGSTAPQTIASGATLTEGYNIINNTALLVAGTNTDPSTVGAIYIDMVLPTNGYYAISSIQVVGLGDNNTTLSYVQITANRQKDNLFHYYQAGLDFKPIKSYLTGWDFPLNPAQFGESVNLGAVEAGYLWDQTIGWQDADTSISASRYSSGLAHNCLRVLLNNTTQFALVQYLDNPQMAEVLLNALSSNIVLSSNQAEITGTISLWYTTDASLPNINTDGECLITSLDANGKPDSLNGNWTEIPRGSLGNAQFTTSGSTSSDDFQSFGFNGWAVPSDVTSMESINYFAIVVGFSEITAANSVFFRSISLVPGSVPTIPAPQSYESVMHECEYYFEKSYENETVPGTAVSDGAILVHMAEGYDNEAEPQRMYAFTNAFTLCYQNIKRVIPINTYYSYLTADTDDSTVFSFYSGTDDLGSAPLEITFSEYFTLLWTTTKSITYLSLKSGGTGDALIQINSTAIGSQAFIHLHYTSDARLGVYE